MRLRELRRGTRIAADIILDASLGSHHGIAAYLGTHRSMGHVLVHILPDFGGGALLRLEQSVLFYREVFGVETWRGEFEEFLYFCEPFPQGEFMFEWLERRESVPLVEALRLIIGLLKILRQAHERGLYHGRLTPKSVLLERRGVNLGLRMMGLGVSQALTASLRLDLDWFDYTFDLEGMSAGAVDIFGVGVLLMSLVSGESGMDGFESTGLLPQPFCGGILQQTMERSLALRMDAYSDILAFTKDLEASLLELDVKQGEMYVGGLVGYESAVRSVSGSISEKNQRGEASGIWSSFVDGLEQSERSSLLCSLTSLAAIRAPADEEDEVEVTRVTSVSEAVLGMRRIQARPAGRRSKGHAVAEPADQSFSGGRFVLGEAASKKLADIQFLEEEDEEDESPTRVVVRPNYLSVSLTSSDGHSTVNALQAVLAMDAGPASVPDHRARVLAAEVTEQTYVLGRDVLYPEEEMPEETALDLPPVVPAPGVVPVSGKGALGETKPQPERRQSKLSRVQVLSVLTLLVVILILAIMVALRFVSA